MTIQPLGEYILIRQMDAAVKTASGLFLPESAKETPDEGIVVAMAAEASNEIKIGDRVIYKKFAGNEIDVEGAKHRLMPVGDLLAKYVEVDAIPE